jgi:hypothetical protein
VNSKSLWTIWFPIYLFVAGLVVAGMFYGRRQALAAYGTPQAQADWQEWVNEARRQQQGQGPVRRRPPQAKGPPALILMRDHFTTCLGGALLITSAVYWSTAFLLHGSVTSSRSPSPREEDDDRERGA